MKGKLTMLVGAAVGYVLGTRAGRERYEQIKAGVTRAWKDPRIQDKMGDAEHFFTDSAKHKVPEMQEKFTGKARDAVDAARAKFAGGHDTFDLDANDDEVDGQSADEARPHPSD